MYNNKVVRNWESNREHLRL